MTDDIKIGWHTIIDTTGTGYGMIGSELYNSFVDVGATMVSHTGFDWDVSVCVSPPRSILIGREKKREDIIFHTMFEAFPMPPEWPHVLNRAGLVWVPSQFVYDLFEQSGVKTPMFKVGYAVNKDLYGFVEREIHDDKPFKVLAWGDGLMSRKNLLHTMKTYMRANLPNATLEVKVTDGIKPQGTITWNGNVRDDITIHSEEWRRVDLIKWLQGGDVGIYLSGGEGYGLMPQEAMATGLPMIVANNTGMKEYLTPQNALLVDCLSHEKCESMSAVFNMELFVTKPNYDQAIDHLRWAYNNRETLLDMGTQGYRDATNTTWEEVALEALYHIREYAKTL